MVNAAQASRDAARDALTLLEVGARSTVADVRVTQGAVKQALEALHELSDCRGRGEWSNASWTRAQRESWLAHMGARNAAHHTSSTVVEIRSASQADNRVRWCIEPTAIASLHSKDQAKAYRTLLDGQPVIPGLRSIVAALAVAIP
jgi:hypothetical protein